MLLTKFLGVVLSLEIIDCNGKYTIGGNMSLVRDLTERETAEYLQICKDTLRNWRWQKCGPAYIKIGRLIRYRIDDLEKYKRQRTVEPLIH